MTKPNRAEINPTARAAKPASMRVIGRDVLCEIREAESRFVPDKPSQRRLTITPNVKMNGKAFCTTAPNVQ
jgi:hypothetical protein